MSNEKWKSILNFLKFKRDVDILYHYCIDKSYYKEKYPDLNIQYIKDEVLNEDLHDNILIKRQIYKIDDTYVQFIIEQKDRIIVKDIDIVKPETYFIFNRSIHNPKVKEIIIYE